LFTISAFSVLVLLADVPQVTANDSTDTPEIHWSDFWSGEWPPGFTMTSDVAIKVRGVPKIASPKDVACTLKKGATYHPWNNERIENDDLKFLTSQETLEHVADEAVEAYVSDPETNDEATLSIKKGDRWTFLAYYAEGFYLMSFNGKQYVAEQDLYGVSSPVDPSRSNDDNYEEWLSLPCDGGAAGWLLMKDIVGNENFGEPNVTEYGQAKDK